MIKALTHAHTLLKPPISQPDLKKHTGHFYQTYKYHFGSYKNACRLAGVPLPRKWKRGIDPRISRLSKRVVKRGGACLSEVYIDKTSPLEWQCKNGHVWQASQNDIFNGDWCPRCPTRKYRTLPIHKHTIEEMHRWAKKKGGKCLSEIYVNKDSKLKWVCDKGHVWEAAPNHIRKGSWCALCARR